MRCQFPNRKLGRKNKTKRKYSQRFRLVPPIPVLQRKKQRFCRLIGPAIGWMGIVTSIMVMKMFTQKTTEKSVSLEVDIYNDIIVVVSGECAHKNLYRKKIHSNLFSTQQFSSRLCRFQHQIFCPPAAGSSD